MASRPEYVHLNGRKLAVEIAGDSDGFPIILMHGTPGSRCGPKPRPIVLYRMGVQLITYDRPGYGDSDRHEGRSVADAAVDVHAIARHLRLERLAVVGRSGGGPHALACGASDLLRDLVTRIAVLVTLAPPDAPDLDWHGGMNVQNRRAHSASEQMLIALLTARAERARTNPQSILDQLEPELTGTDHTVVRDIVLGNLLRESYAEAVRTSPHGWIDDGLAFHKDWGFDPASIKVPVKIWHGDQDGFSPTSHSRWLATRIPTAEAHIEKGVGHFTAVEVLPDILSWLTDPVPVP
ncbi:alpha/beta hydrolase [Dactylosporangium salmoneum]|uniref:alpha/beta fold hydrolase n=1 Tax=Dactylosporangium salmoneum TaxID=53361 RepID=UPI0031D52E8F